MLAKSVPCMSPVQPIKRQLTAPIVLLARYGGNFVQSSSTKVQGTWSMPCVSGNGLVHLFWSFALALVSGQS